MDDVAPGICSVFIRFFLNFLKKKKTRNRSVLLECLPAGGPRRKKKNKISMSVRVESSAWCTSRPPRVRRAVRRAWQRQGCRPKSQPRIYSPRLKFPQLKNKTPHKRLEFVYRVIYAPHHSQNETARGGLLRLILFCRSVNTTSCRPGGKDAFRFLS